MNMVIGLSVFIGVSVVISRDVFILIPLVLTVGEPVMINHANEKKIICRIILTMGAFFQIILFMDKTFKLLYTIMTWL